MDDLKGSRTAVFAATMTEDYSQILAKDPDNMPATSLTGAVISILPNRISWYYDLRGPSVHVDTACSGSMVALDLACQSILTGRSSAVRQLPNTVFEYRLTSFLGSCDGC